MRNTDGEKRRPASTADLLASERRLLNAMQRMRFGRYERLRIENGEIVEPWPITIQVVKLGASDIGTGSTTQEQSLHFGLKNQVVEFLEYVRTVEKGAIRILEVRHGLPFTMEIEPGVGGVSHA